MPETGEELSADKPVISREQELAESFEKARARVANSSLDEEQKQIKLKALTDKLREELSKL